MIQSIHSLLRTIYLNEIGINGFGHYISWWIISAILLTYIVILKIHPLKLLIEKICRITRRLLKKCFKIFTTILSLVWEFLVDLWKRIANINKWYLYEGNTFKKYKERLTLAVWAFISSLGLYLKGSVNSGVFSTIMIFF